MKLRKLTPAEVAQLCACGLRAHEWGHARGCPRHHAGRQPDGRHCGQRAYILALLLAAGRRGWARGRRPC